MESDPVTFRKYTPEDLQACTALAREAWPLPPEIAAGVETGEMMSVWIGSTVASSTYAEVAVDEHGVVGLLFGEVEGQKALERSRSTLGIEVQIMSRGLTGKYGDLIRTIRFMLGFFITELKLLVNRPGTDAEISMLIVGQAHRGRGLGKELVDRFIEAAKKQGARSISLYTDDQTSNWRFYEAYGFRQVAKFHDNGSSYYAGKRSTALIYRLDL